jgi:tetratricopeptide (TPR) repeat protein
MLAISVGMGAFTIYIERHGGGASGSRFEIGFLDRVLISGRSFWFYLGKLVWPAGLAFIYPRWNVNATVWWQWTYPIAMVGAAGGAWVARKRIGSGTFLALMHFYISTSLLGMFVILYMTRFSFVADHWAYFGSLSVIALAAAGIARAADLTGPEWARPLECGIGAMLCLGLGALSWAQSRIYTDAETVWRATIAVNPGAAAAHADLGSELFLQGRLDEAIAEFREALQIDPSDPDAHFDLGKTLWQEGRAREAIDEYRRALASDPSDAEARANLGVALFEFGERAEAMEQFREAVRLNPAYVEGHTDLGKALIEEGQIEPGIKEYRAALRLDGGSAPAHYNLGLGLLQLGRNGEAISEFRAALAADPSSAEACYDLSNALYQDGQAAEAIAEGKRVLSLQPSNPEIQNRLAWMLATATQPGLRDGPAAVELALRANAGTGGDNPEVLRTLAAARAQAGDYQEALEAAQTALQLTGTEGNASLVGELQKEIKLYQGKQAY